MFHPFAVLLAALQFVVYLRCTAFLLRGDTRVAQAAQCALSAD
jgi:hypothetical protein